MAKESKQAHEDMLAIFGKMLASNQLDDADRFLDFVEGMLAAVNQYAVKVSELRAENERLKKDISLTSEHFRILLDRKTNSTTIIVEVPSSSNGGRFIVTCPREKAELECAEALEPALHLYAKMVGAKIGKKSIIGAKPENISDEPLDPPRTASEETA